MRLMSDKRERLPAQPPTVPPPRPFTERRVGQRRVTDQVAQRETALLARALDILASGDDPEARLAGLLRLLAKTVGARRAAVVADGIDRRAAVAVDPGEDPDDASELAAWLDANAPRSRVQRAASGRAPISFIVAGRAARLPADAADGAAPDEPVAAGRAGTEPVAEAGRPHYALLPIPSAGDIALGFEFRRASDAEHVAERLPPNLARHAAVALALVTSQLATDRELAELRAREAERATFVSTVAHELRTPLTGLRGYLELILGGQVVDPAVERDFLERSRAIVGSMGDLVGDLLELSRLESGTLGLELGPFSVAEACSQVASGLLPIAIDRGIRLTTALPARLRVATADRRRVEQIVTNLGGNALKFTPSGGNVEIVARFEGLVAIIAVRDDGPGIPVEDHPRIFERFHRVAGHERITGTGLGLPIARDLARQMGGDLEVASVPGAGSSFVLVLPGPADIAPETIGANLARTLEAEEQLIEERAVLRAIESGGDGPWTVVDEIGPRSGRSSGRLRALPNLRHETPTTA
jgi:signal transduction histidine kinase